MNVGSSMSESGRHEATEREQAREGERDSKWGRVSAVAGAGAASVVSLSKRAACVVAAVAATGVIGKILCTGQTSVPNTSPHHLINLSAPPFSLLLGVMISCLRQLPPPTHCPFSLSSEERGS